MAAAKEAMSKEVSRLKRYQAKAGVGVVTGVRTGSPRLGPQVSSSVSPRPQALLSLAL